MDEVLPAIRNHGLYATDNVIDNILNNPDFGIELLTRLKGERAARVEAERKKAILMHVNKTYRDCKSAGAAIGDTVKQDPGREKDSVLCKWNLGCVFQVQ